MGITIGHICRTPASNAIGLQHPKYQTCPYCQAEKALWEIKELHRNVDGNCFICSQTAKTNIPHPCETFNLVQPF